MRAFNTFYYLTPEDCEIIFPSKGKYSEAQNFAPHICVNASIDGSLASLALEYPILGKQFKVYTVETDDYYVPKMSEAPAKKATEEVWLNYAIEPEYVGTIEITSQAGEFLESIGEALCYIPKWNYKFIDKELHEDSRTLLVSKSRSVGPYKNQLRGKNRFERKKHSQIAKTVKQYNKIDMNKLFKEDILEVAIPVVGETDSYTVNFRLEGVVAEIARNIKTNKNKLEFKTVVQSLTKIFNSANVFVKCSCPDYKYRFAHWNIVNRVSVDDTSKDPGPGKGIRNPDDKLGRGCKHVLLCLANGDWVMKVSSVINNYINYAEEKLQKPFLKLIFPKLYGFPFEEASEHDLLPDDFKLDSSTSIIDTINDYGRNRGKYKPGTNKNPVTGTGGKVKTKTMPGKEDSPEEKKTVPATAEKPDSTEGDAENDKTDK